MDLRLAEERHLQEPDIVYQHDLGSGREDESLAARVNDGIHLMVHGDPAYRSHVRLEASIWARLGHRRHIPHR